MGEKIPSVRDMAQGLKVTANTVMHAYQEIERYGLTETRRGQGYLMTREVAEVAKVAVFTNVTKRYCLVLIEQLRSTLPRL